MSTAPTRSVVALLAAAFAFPAAAHAQIVHVDSDLTTGANDGSSWSNAFQGSSGLHQALASAMPGEEIWVTGGTYLPSSTGDIDERFRLVADNVQLRGGFTGTEANRFQRPAPGLSPTILSGDLMGNDDGSPASGLDNSRKVLVVRGDRLLVENLDVIGGRNVPSTSTIQFFGALEVGSSVEVTLESCRVHDNFGGGALIIAGERDATSRVIDCTFERNGAYGLQVDHFPSAFSQIQILRSAASDNGGSGFLIAPDDFGTEEFNNCLAARNGEHGLHYLMFPEAGLLRTVRNCTFVENQLAGVRMDTCQCFFGEVSVEESIVWGNGTPLSGWAVASNSIVQGLADPILGADPQFRDAATGDFSLLPSSPAIDRGLGIRLEPGELDLARRYRAVDLPAVANAGSGPEDFVDYGAFEFTGTVGENDGCAATANSTGRAGRMFARGSLDVATNSIALRADRLPPGQFGLFLASTELRPLPAPAPAAGLCLGGAIGRFNAPGQVQAASPDGVITLLIDLSALPQPSAFVSAQPGETWRFQLWHRDVTAPSAFTGTVSTTLR